MNDRCPFCGIAEGEIDADVIAEGEEWVAFRDLNPQAPTHVLLIPREHVTTINELGEGHDELIGEMTRAAAEIAAAEGIDDSGYRLVLNCNEGAGQSVWHVHMHLLGGRRMRWPPG